MKLRSWSEERDHRTINTGDGFVTVSKGETVIVIVARKGEPVFGLLDELQKRVLDGES